MAIITISRGSYSKGKEIAEKTAKRLGYECIGRDVLIETSKEFNIPEIKLVRALHDAPSILDRFVYGKEKYITYIQAEILRHLKKDNTVYHGLAGQFFLKGVSHVVKVRVIADMEDRVRNEIEREGMSREKALKILKKDDEERRNWSKSLYGIDTWDPSLYDLVIYIKKITVNDAVDIICNAAGLKHFETTPESQKAMEDLALAAEVKSALIAFKPDIDVKSSNGTVYVETKAHESQQEALIQDMERIANAIPGVKELRVKVSFLDAVD